MALETQKSPRHVRKRSFLPPRGLLARPDCRRLGRQGLALLLGAAFARAAVAEDIRPFGVAYIAAAGHPLAAAAGAFLSYLTLGRAGLVCGAAVMVTLTCRMVLEGTALGRKRVFFPGCAALALLFTKGVVAAAGGVRAVLLLLCECTLCLGFALMLREARDSRSPLALWGRLTAALGGILTLLPVTVWGGWSPAGLGAVFLVLCAGAFGGPAAGVCVGTAFGACVDLVLGRSPQASLIWCVTGLAAGLGKKREPPVPPAAWPPCGCTAGRGCARDCWSAFRRRPFWSCYRKNGCWGWRRPLSGLARDWKAGAGLWPGARPCGACPTR